MVNTLHFHLSRVQLEELDDVPRKWFNMAPVCDAPAEIPDTREGMFHIACGARLYFGEGGVAVAAILNRMPEFPYSIELPNLGSGGGVGVCGTCGALHRIGRKYFAD